MLKEFMKWKSTPSPHMVSASKNTKMFFTDSRRPSWEGKPNCFNLVRYDTKNTVSTVKTCLHIFWLRRTVVKSLLLFSFFLEYELTIPVIWQYIFFCWCFSVAQTASGYSTDWRHAGIRAFVTFIFPCARLDMKIFYKNRKIPLHKFSMELHSVDNIVI